MNAVVPVGAQGTRLARLRQWSGVDAAVGFTVLGRGWQSLAGVLTLLLIARSLSPEEQGYYYTFGSLVALQIVFELGFSFVIQQMASHETAHLEIGADGRVSGDARAHARLASVLQKSLRWYTVAALVFLVGLLTAGLVFFGTHAHPGHAVAWRLPWVMVSIAAALAFQVDPVFAFLEGCGYVSAVARTRLWQALTGTLLAWAALLTHHGLFAPAMVIFGQAGVGAVWLWGRRALLLGLFRHEAGEHRIAWFTEVWPFQWRIALSWVSGYFIFQLFNPVLFAYRGAVAAGQMGMSLSIGNSITNIGLAWIATKSAPFGALIARRRFLELDRIFFRALRQSSIVCFGCCVLAFLGAVFLYSSHLPLANRVLPPLPFALLLATIANNHIVFAETVYLRSHKQEKFLPLSICSAVLIASSTYFVGRSWGALGMMAGYLSVNVVVGLICGTFLFLRYRKAWHA